jgi:hypothetical protein
VQRIDFYWQYWSAYVFALVNWEVARIFNRVWEVQKLAQNGKILTETGVFETRGFAFTMAALTISSP